MKAVMCVLNTVFEHGESKRKKVPYILFFKAIDSFLSRLSNLMPFLFDMLLDLWTLPKKHALVFANVF
jgi:hypothetical protein